MQKMTSVLILAAACCLAHSQTPVTVAPIPKLQFLDVNGKPLSGGCVFTYAAGTTTPQATYTDSTGTTQNTNPVVLDSGGRASIWLSSQAYKMAVWSSSGVACASGIQQYSIDGVAAFNLNSASQIVSAASNPASVGFIRMANGDLVNWRNIANAADIGFAQAGAASTANGNLADVLRYGNASTGGLQAQRYLDFSAAPAQSGVLAGGNSVCLAAARNAAGNGDVCAIEVNSSNVVLLGGSGGVSITGPASLNGPANLNGQGITNVASMTSASSNPAQIGVVRVADTDTAVAFRNHANTQDIGGLQKDGSDVVHVGGTPGASTNGPFQVNGTLTVTGTTSVQQLTVNSGVTGPAFQHTSVTSCTTPASANAACNTTLTWPQAFADQFYTSVCTTAAQNSGGSILIDSVVNTATTMTIQIQNIGGNSAASQVVLNCIGIH